MKVIVCIDEQNGMLFNGRRVSSDKAVVDKIYQIAKGHPIFIDIFSVDLIKHALLKKNFIEYLKEDDFCFIENIKLSDHKDKIDTVYVFKWNRSYPSDVKLDLDLSTYHLSHSEDFAGNSHDNITLEVWKK